MTTCPRCRRTYADGVRFCPADGSLLANVVDPYLGRTLMGQFQLVSVAGRGAMGTVYRAEQALMDRTVAVKVLRSDLLKDETAVKRFLREAQAAARLSHPNIVTVHVVGSTDDGVPFIVMEFIEGHTLGQLLDTEPVIAPRRALRIARQIASALAEAHAQGIVHRDLKADNILLAQRRHEQEFVKVLDFGIAKLLSGEGGEIAQLTRDGTIFGTPHYIAPEQAAGHDVDGRADLYSLGVMLFRMVTGRLPFDGNSGMQVLMRHLKDQPPRPRAIRPELPEPVQSLILTLLEKDRDKRFTDAEDFIAALDAVDQSLAKTEHVEPSRTLMGIPVPPRFGEESRHVPPGGLPVAPRPGAVPHVAPVPAVVAPLPVERPDDPAATLRPDDPTRTRAGDVGLDKWSEGGDAKAAEEAAANPDFSTSERDAIGGRLGGGGRRRWPILVGIGAAGAIGLAAFFGRALIARHTTTPVAPVAANAADAGEPPPAAHPALVAEQVATTSSGGYAVRIGFELPPTAGEPNVLHMQVNAGKGEVAPGTRLELSVRHPGEHEDRVPARADREGYAAGVLFRSAGPHQLRVIVAPPAGKPVMATFSVDVARAAPGAQARSPWTPTRTEPASGRTPPRARRPGEEDPTRLPVTVIPAESAGSDDVLPRALGPAPTESSPSPAPSPGSGRPFVPTPSVPSIKVPPAPALPEPSSGDDPYQLLDEKKR